MIFDALRLFIGVALLLYASYTDLKKRRVKNIVWVAMAGAGAIILIAEMLHLTNIADPDLSFKLINLTIIPIIIFSAWLLYHLRLLFGGADAKAWMAIAVLTPLWPGLQLASWAMPALPSPMPFPFTVISNAVILFLFFPLAFALYNIARGNVEVPQLFFGYKMKTRDAKNRFVWLMEKVENGKTKISLFPSRSSDLDKELRELETLGKKEVWVTPKIPFMIPLTIGFIVSFIIGDLVYNLVLFFIG